MYKKELKTRMKLWWTFELIAYLLFAVAAISHTLIDHINHELFETQRSVSEQLDILSDLSFDGTQGFKGFWLYVSEMKNRVVLSGDLDEYIELDLLKPFTEVSD